MGDTVGDNVGDTVGLNVGESVSSLLSSESSPSFLIGCFFPELSCSSRRTILADEAELTSMIEIAIAPKNFIVNELDSELEFGNRCTFDSVSSGLRNEIM